MLAGWPQYPSLAAGSKAVRQTPQHENTPGHRVRTRGCPVSAVTWVSSSQVERQTSEAAFIGAQTGMVLWRSFRSATTPAIYGPVRA